MQSSFSDLDQLPALQGLQSVLAKSLSSRGITVRVALENSILYILLEASQVPHPPEMMALMDQHRLELHRIPAQTLKLYGRSRGETFTDWVTVLDIETLPDGAESWSSSWRSDSRPFAQGQDSQPLGFEPSRDNLNFPDPDSSLPLTAPRQRVDHFIVCGLGRLGQHCAMALTSFAQHNVAVHVTAIDRQHPDHWEVDQLSDWLQTGMITGDCRQDGVLKQAGIERCRAILIVTQDENTNIETAIAARRLNPTVRLIVRSGKQNLNELLKERLENFAAFEPIELPAESFALAALGDEILGAFKVGDHQLRVIQHQVNHGEVQFENLPVHKLYKETSRLLKYSPAIAAETSASPMLATHDAATVAPSGLLERLFYDWEPDTQIRPGDTLFYLEIAGRQGVTQLPTEPPQWNDWGQHLNRLRQGNWRQLGNQVWNWLTAERTRRVTSLGFLSAFLLGILGSVLLRFTVADMTWQTAISSTVILLLGGYGDVFGGLEGAVGVPWWVQVICLLITAAGLLFFLSVLGLLADRLLSSRFEFLQRRPPVPRSHHVVVVGLGRVGQRIASLLHEFRQPLVCLTHSREHEDLLPQVPLVSSPILQGLEAVNLAAAKSVIVATDDQMLNLEVALTARNIATRMNRTLQVVIRAQDQRFCDHLSSLMPDAKPLCVYALTAEAFAGAAFGENILHLFQLAKQTILVTEYRIEAADTLNGKLLAQVAYGYGVVPIAYQAVRESTLKVLPSDHVRLQTGDRLVVLATINGLQRIEWGTLTPPRRWQLQALKPLDAKVTFYAGNTLENISGCSLSEARAFMDNLPQTMDVPNVMELDLYDHQADHLLRKLRKLLPVRLLPLR